VAFGVGGLEIDGCRLWIAVPDWGRYLGGFVALVPCFEKDFFEGLFVLGFVEVDDGGYGAVDGVEDDLFNFTCTLGFGLVFGAWKVGGRYLQAVEEQTGAFGVEVI
jgi:hypothetical protein